MQVTTFCIDLAKNKFRVHGDDARRETRVAKTLKRQEVLRFFEQRAERCRVVMEACAGAHDWGRQLIQRGFNVRLIPPQFVTPLRIGNKTDPNDTDAIFEASDRPKVRPVPVKSVAQQDALLAHSTREQWMGFRTALMNPIRGALAERGIVWAKTVAALKAGVPELLCGERQGEQTGRWVDWLRQRVAHWRWIDEQIAEEDAQIQAHFGSTPECRQIEAIEGIGVQTASATVARVGDASQFESSRRMSRWLGLTPKENSSGERRRLGAITQRGQTYLRTCLVHGGRSVVAAVGRKLKVAKPLNERERWVYERVKRRGVNQAAVAIAAKNARIIWALLTTGQAYRPAAVVT